MASETAKSVNYTFKWIIKNATRENIVKNDRQNTLETEIIETNFDGCVVKW
mgnify:CR=1 FL=1